MAEKTDDEILDKLPEWYNILRELYLKACGTDE
jgi:hypothetical protein